MANYSLVIGSQFKPFSYSEMLQPVLMATQAHQELENQYGELATKASVWEEMANEQTDPYAYKMYKTYANDLEEQAGQLAREGLNAASRRDMLNMRARYSKEITPIEQAYTARQKQAEEQQKALLQDPTLMLSRRASTTSLDDYIRNPQLAYESYSGKLITAQAASAASALAKEMQEKPRKWRSILGNSYYETMMQKGFSSQAVLQAIQDNPNAAPQLTRIVEDAINSSGVRNWGDQATLNRAYDYARQGLWNAVGDTQYQTIQNQDYLNPLQKLQKKKLERELNQEPPKKLYYRAVPKTTVDGDKNTRQMNEDLKLIQEIMSNPSLLDKKSTRTVRDPKYISPDPMMSFVMDSGLGESRQETYYPYQEKLAELSKRYGNINYTTTDGKLSGGNLAELAQQLDRDIRSSAVRAFSYKPNITQSDLITQVLKENTRSYYRRSNSTGLWELDDNKKGDEVDIDDLNSYFTSDADIDFDPDLGFIINSTDSKGKTRSAILDTELLDDQNRTFSRAQQAIRVALENGEDELATTLIDATMEAFYKRYNTLEKRQSNTFSKEE